MLLTFLKQLEICIYKYIFVNIGKVFFIISHLFLTKINLKYGSTQHIVDQKLP